MDKRWSAGMGPFAGLFDLVMHLGAEGLLSWRIEVELGGRSRRAYRWNRQAQQIEVEGPTDRDDGRRPHVEG